MGPMGLAVFGVLLIGALFRFVNSGSKRRNRNGTAGLDLDFSEEEVEGKASRPAEYSDFPALLERFVMPLAQAHPHWERLDGAQGVPGQIIAWFYWNNVRYGLGGETHIQALLQAREWMMKHPEADPLVVRHTRSGAGRLTLRPEIGWKNEKAIRIETG